MAIDPQYKNYGSQGDANSNLDDGLRSLALNVVTEGVGRVGEILGLGSGVGAAAGALFDLLKMIGDEVQKNKCQLKCCPKNNLAGSWACKYQTYETCNGSYSDYPGRGDHACWWNSLLQRCETGKVCRDKTFNWFSLFGSVCPPCDQCPNSGVQWSTEALKNAGLPIKYYVAPSDEFEWCAPRGSPGDCKSNKNQIDCERSYADENGDKNCRWVNNKCVKGNKCDNAKERVSAAKKLGLSYFGGSWKNSNGEEITYIAQYTDKQSGCKLADNFDVHKITELAEKASTNQVYSGCIQNCRNDLRTYALCACQCMESL
jgi:hypothetical protein